MYLLVHRQLSRLHSRDTILGLGETRAIIDQPQSPDQYDTLLAEFEPKQNVNSEALSLPLVEDPRSFQPTPDDPLDASHLDEIFFSVYHPRPVKHQRPL